MNTPRIGTLVTVSSHSVEDAKASTDVWMYVGAHRMGFYHVINPDHLAGGARFSYIHPALKFEPDHILTRLEIYAAMDAGYILHLKGSHVWAERNDESEYAPYVWHSISDEAELVIECDDEWLAAEEPPEPSKPKKRPMTREEMMGFVAHHPEKIVVRDGDQIWLQSGFFMFVKSRLDQYEWATIAPDGTIGEPQQFPMVEDV